MSNADIDIFGSTDLRTSWCVRGLLRAWSPAQERKRRQKRSDPFKAILAACATGMVLSAAALAQPEQMSLMWPTEETAASAREVLLQSVKQLRSMDRDWDGRGASKPVEASIARAEYILPQLPNVKMEAKVGLNEEGNVFLKLGRGATVSYLTIEPRVMHLLVMESGQENLYIDDEPFNGKTIPSRIKSVLDLRLKS